MKKLNKKISSMLSISRGAGFLKAGDVAVVTSLSGKEANLILIATDASDNAKKKYLDKSAYYKVEAILFETKENLGKAIGKQECAVLSIIDKGMSEKIKELIKIEE